VIERDDRREGAGRSVRPAVSDEGRKPRSAAHEIERYAALFAERTRVMKSSAMRDLMALTARDDLISFSGGLPDTSTFAPGFFTELMSRVATDSVAKALQYGPTEGLADVREAIALVMEAEGMTVDPDSILATSGGQQAIDLVCKDPDRPGRRDHRRSPHLPGRGADVLLLPGRRDPDPARPRRHADRQTEGGAGAARQRGAAARSSSTRSRTSTTRPA